MSSVLDKLKMIMEHLWNYNDIGEPEYSEKNLSHPNTFTKWSGLELNLGFLSDTPASILRLMRMKLIRNLLKLLH